MSRCVLIDPAGVRDDYEWEINWSEESEFGRERAIEYGANTGNTGLVRQQGDVTPLVLRATGTILHKTQIVEMNAWFELCENQTVYLRDFAGDEYEGTITLFKPTRLKTIKNPRDFANMPYWYYHYEFAFDVLLVRDGIWEGASP